MRRVSERLSSLAFTTIVLAALVLWLTWGILMAGSTAYSEGFFLMNSRLVREWLMDADGGSTLIKFWFTGLCFITALLGVNLIFCSWNKILRIMRAKLSRPRFLMLVIHMVFGLVALGHFGSFMLGYRYEKVLLGEGQSFGFRDGYRLKVDRVSFVDDPAVLEKSPRYLLSNDFHYRRNFADVVLFREGRVVLKDKVFVLRPLRRDGVQITLSRFTPPGGAKGAKRSGNPPGKADRQPKGGGPRVMFVISKNPVLIPFLVVYGVMIVGMGIYLAMTWQKPGVKMNC